MTAIVVPLSAAAGHRAARRIRQRNRQQCACCPLTVAGGAIHVCAALYGHPYGAVAR